MRAAAIATSRRPRRSTSGGVPIRRFAAPVVYVAALGATVAAWGLPVARDQLFLWLGLGMAAFSVSAWRSWGRMVLDWLPLFGLLVLYDFLRGAVAVAPGRAHVAPQVAVDKAIGL